MTSSTLFNSDLAALQSDIAALKHDVSSLIAHLKTGVTNSAQTAASQLDGGTRELYRGATVEGERAVKAISHQIEKQPLAALLIVLGLGYIGGRLLLPR